MEFQNIHENDWEMNEFDNDSQQQQKELKLEDFMDSASLDTGDSFGQNSDLQNALLKKTIEDVHNVLALAQAGKTIPQIAQELGLEQQYVYNIQVSAQGFREDDEIAVAHLVMMG